MCLLSVLVACSSSSDAPSTESSTLGSPSAPPDSSSADTSTTVLPLDGRLRASGYTVTPGKFSVLDLSSCCDSSCAGNNPSSPYGAFFVPPAPNQSPEPDADANGLATDFHLREDEAIVFVGPTPPESKYFGFTPYLTKRGDREVAASLSETLNDLVINVNAPAGSSVFAQQTAIIAAADQTTVDRITGVLQAQGIPAGAINTLVFDPAIAHFGFSASDDTFSVLFRVALPTDQSALAAYLANPIGSLYRVTPPVTLTSKPLPSPVARPKNLTNTETALTSQVDALGAQIVADNPGYQSEELSVDDGVPDPSACIDGTSVCAFDNRDTTYPAISPRQIFPTDDDFYVVYGVNHVSTNKVTYANTSVYGLSHLYGIKSATTNDYQQNAQLYSYKIARDCTGETYCLAIPAGSCPSGLDDKALGSIAFRTYLEPSTKTAPDPSTLVRDRVIHFHH